MPPISRRTQPVSQVELRLPSTITLDPPGRRERGTIWVQPAGRPPKLRFQPGSFIRYGGKLYEVIFAYRVAADPSEWRYCCEERQELTSGEPSGIFPGLTEALGAGDTTPRVVGEIFRDTQEAWCFFSEIPTGHNRTTFTNKQLVRAARVVSSGEVLGPEHKAIKP